ncbi:erythromycin esterase family protein [Mesobacillus maritimus]|uniref:erythromycin esterase family protein n=1 Tax=Mesobacillus maritimus TaxID=1643336 RepID=UPI0020420A08|nr:erythromycin esterase family protein [Mesobacillus maritimus]MCM3587387.1 erythromycin esterase family protein [Mesobacillus maritimus]
MSVEIIEAIKKDAIPLKHKEHFNFKALLDASKKAKYILLGESSHGTSEFYTTRAELSKTLIKDKGFSFIVVEGDWPACQQVNRYIKGYEHDYKNAREALTAFGRWPTWMWANKELIDFVEWLKVHNQGLPPEKRVGFYGMDVYSLWESMDEIIKYLEKTDAPELETAKKAFACFEPFNRDPQLYGVSGSFYREDCKEEVIQLLTELTLKKKAHTSYYEEGKLNLEVNALVTANSENYYRTMVTHDNESWNIRDRHMVEVINSIATYYGEAAKGIVWAHNTHVGDARATDMADEELVNVGQLLREQEGNENVFIVGFGTHRGTVIAADEWGVDFERMLIPPAQSGSWEDFMHQANPHDKVLLFHKTNRAVFNKKIGHRAIGVVYHPQYEHYGNYVPSVLPERYDAFIYINSTTALEPLEVEEVVL